MKTLPDGRLLFPHRGNPPSLLPNYSRDPGDPYILIPDFLPCKFRIIQQKICPKGNPSVNWFCTLKGIIVNPPICEICEERQE